VSVYSESVALSAVQICSVFFFVCVCVCAGGGGERSLQHTESRITCGWDVLQARGAVHSPQGDAFSHHSVSVQYKIIIIHNCVSCLIYIYNVHPSKNNSLYPWTGCILHGDYINKSVSDTFMSIIVQGFCDLRVFSDQSESSISESPVSAASDS